MITYRNLGRTGRLGNQLFQIASTIGIGRQVGDSVMFPADWPYRPYFRIPDFMFGDIPGDAKESSEFVHHMDPRALPYLQDINLFWHCIDSIRHYFLPSKAAEESLLELKLPNMPRLGIHVRRGDNIFDPGVPNKNDYHLCPGTDYYSRGIWAIADEMFMNLRSTVCISDDVPWCEENIKADYYGTGIAHPKENHPNYFTTEPTDWLDLFTLTTCNYFVISGSTFGIWGAILSGSSIVVRPDKVYGPLLNYIDESLLFPPHWKVIPHVA